MAIFRKQTKLWTCGDGRKVRICDMTSDHLAHAIAYLERYAERLETVMVTVPNPFAADIASDRFDQEQDTILKEGLDPSDVSPLYDNLFDERERRKHEPNSTKH